MMVFSKFIVTVCVIGFVGCSASRNENISNTRNAAPTTATANTNVASAPPLVSPTPIAPPKEVKVDIQAEKKEAMAILQALRVIEQQGRSMQPLRDADTIESMRKCGDLMRQRMQAARDLIPRAEKLRMRGGTFLNVAARELTNCVTCQKRAIETCDIARESIREAEKAIKAN